MVGFTWNMSPLLWLKMGKGISTFPVWKEWWHLCSREAISELRSLFWIVERCGWSLVGWQGNLTVPHQNKAENVWMRSGNEGDTIFLPLVGGMVSLVGWQLELWVVVGGLVYDLLNGILWKLFRLDQYAFADSGGGFIREAANSAIICNFSPWWFAHHQIVSHVSLWIRRPCKWRTKVLKLTVCRQW